MWVFHGFLAYLVSGLGYLGSVRDRLHLMEGAFADTSNSLILSSELSTSQPQKLQKDCSPSKNMLSQPVDASQGKAAVSQLSRSQAPVVLPCFLASPVPSD